MIRPNSPPQQRLAVPFLLITALISLFLPVDATGSRSSSSRASYIVQAASAAAAAAAVQQANGSVTARLGIINGVVATLDGSAVARLQADPQIALHADGAVQAADDGHETDTRGYLLYPAAAVNANALHPQQVTGPKVACTNYRVTVSPTQQETRPLQGWGVTVAVIDSGFIKFAHPEYWTYHDPSGLLMTGADGRCVGYRDFLPRTKANGNNGGDANNSVDQNGHGTHVISTIADYHETPLAPNVDESPVGVAPDVNLLIARALDKNGAGTYASVITAIDWIVANKALYNVRVLNLSLYAPVTGPYWADPLNQAVMRAWQAGIVVVAAAGNSGPGPGTITVPGNVPYVVTVGAIKSGRYTVSGFDELAQYSSRGPTESAFVKPDVVVPASRTIAPMGNDSLLARQVQAGRIAARDVNIDFGPNILGKYNYYQLSGTSMAAAEVSGIAALILQAAPALTNDQVKYRLMATARPAKNGTTGAPAYTLWEQGAGLVDTPQAVLTTTTNLANSGLDVTQDLTTSTHYWGYTSWDPLAGEFSLTVDGGTTRVWDGTTRVWDGTTRVWDGTTRVWDGTTRVWDGTTRVWEGSLTTSWTLGASLWAGATRLWAGSIPTQNLSTASTAQILLNDP